MYTYMCMNAYIVIEEAFAHVYMHICACIYGVVREGNDEIKKREEEERKRDIREQVELLLDTVI